METVLAALVTAFATALIAYWAHRREVKKDTKAGEVATSAMHNELDIRMKSHVAFVEERIQSERKYWETKLEEEREECDERITGLAGRLGIAESELRKLRRTQGDSEEGGLPSN